MFMHAATTLDLVPVDASMAALVRGDPHGLAVRLQASVPEAWPTFPHAFLAERFAEAECRARGPWGGFVFVDRGREALVGNGGFKGAPDAAGEVEIGYEVAPAFRRAGYATRATRELVRRAFDAPAVRRVMARTLASSVESAGVLVKCGFQRVGETPNDRLGPIWTWARTRSVLMDAAA